MWRYFNNAILNKKKAARLAMLLILAAACSAALFYSSYQFDNKYTRRGTQAQNGVLTLSAKDLENRPVMHLTEGWEIYRGKLLTPVDFISGLLSADEFVFIGEYGGFEGNTQDGTQRSPHGSATYRLNIHLPPEPRYYALELPEIFSAYRLYINGEVVTEMGEIGQIENYRAETGNARAVIQAAGSMEIIIAVTNYSHYYSGMVYPPAFGDPAAVDGLLNARFAVRSAAVAVAVIIAALYLVVWFLLRKSKAASANGFLPALYAALCVCFAVYISYPVVKTLWHGGMALYYAETTAYAAMLLLTGLIQARISGIPVRVARAFATFGAVICGFSIIVPQIMGDSLNLMMGYSDVLTVFYWICALFLLASAAYGIIRGLHDSGIMLVAAAVFAVSLVMYRALPLFEPVRFGWFSETAGVVFIVAIGIVMAREIAGQFHMRLALENRTVFQERQFRLIEENTNRAIEARHNVRYHITMLQGLLSGGKYNEASEHLSEYADSMADVINESYCKNARVNTLLRHFAAKAAEIGADMSIRVSLPDDTGISNVDLTDIFSVCLENAVAACLEVPREKRRIYVACIQAANQLVITIDNSFSGKPPVIKGGRFMSTKRSGFGTGLASVMRIAKSYGGMADFAADGDMFRSGISLPLRRRPNS